MRRRLNHAQLSSPFPNQGKPVRLNSGTIPAGATRARINAFICDETKRFGRKCHPSFLRPDCRHCPPENVFPAGVVRSSRSFPARKRCRESDVTPQKQNTRLPARRRGVRIACAAGCRWNDQVGKYRTVSAPGATTSAILLISLSSVTGGSPLTPPNRAAKVTDFFFWGRLREEKPPWTPPKIAGGW